MAEKIIAFPEYFLFDLGFNIVVFVPDADLDAVGGIGAFEDKFLVPVGVEFAVDRLRAFPYVPDLHGYVRVRSSRLVLSL